MNRNEELAVICSCDRIDFPDGFINRAGGILAAAGIFGFIGFVVGCLIMSAILIK